MLDAHRGQDGQGGWLCECWEWILDSTTAADVLKGCVFPAPFPFWNSVLYSPGWTCYVAEDGLEVLISIAFISYELVFQVCTSMSTSHSLLISGLET